MRSYDEHNNQFAINVKNPEMATTEDAIESLRVHKVKDFEQLLEQIDFDMSQWTECNLKNLEISLRNKYPTFDLHVNQTGRSGGWIELTGTWGRIDALEDESTHRQSIINNYIVPTFEKRVNELLSNWNTHMSLLCNSLWN